MSSKEWKTYKIGDLCLKITSGGTPNTRKSEYYGGEIPWLKTQEVNFNRIYNTETFINNEGLMNSSAKWIPIDSVIVAMYGVTAGKLAVNKIPLTTNQACCNLVIDRSKADYNFIYYNLLSRFSEIAGMAVGGAQQNLNAGMIRELEILIPNIHIQKNISSILSSLDDKIELNRQTNQTLEGIAQTLFQEMCVPKGDELPEGWRVGKLGEVYKTTSGGTPSRAKMEYYKNGTINWVKSKELGAFYVLETEEKITNTALKNSSAKLLPENSILMAMYGATVAEISILGEPATCNQAICAILPNDKYPYSFVYEFLKNKRDEIKSMAVGAAQQNISQVVIQGIEMIIPSKEVVFNFHKRVEPIYLQIKNNIQESQTLIALRDSLLPKLMKGEIEI